MRWTVEKNERYDTSSSPTTRSTHPRGLPPREDRELEAPLFPGFTDARLRTAITRRAGDRDAALLAARAAPAPRIALLQAHRLARRGRRTAWRLQARRGRPLPLRAHRLNNPSMCRRVRSLPGTLGFPPAATLRHEGKRASGLAERPLAASGRSPRREPHPAWTDDAPPLVILDRSPASRSYPQAQRNPPQSALRA